MGGSRGIKFARFTESPQRKRCCSSQPKNTANGIETNGLYLEANTVQFKKKRDPERFEQAKADIAELIDQAQAGDIELAYVDESGFSPQPPNRSAWTRPGETHAVTAKRAQRLNVIGAMLSSGKFLMAKLWKSVNGLYFFAFLMAMMDRFKKPLVVILDNASIHTAKKLKPYWNLLEEKGMRFYFLPPYSPELNRIEILWRKIKYEWLSFKSYSASELEQAIEEIGNGLGAKYTLTFF